jgi:hypothetical protein
MGRTPEDKPVTEDHRFTDEFPMAEGFAENVEFFTMTYEAARAVAHIGIWPIRDPVPILRKCQDSRLRKRLASGVLPSTPCNLTLGDINSCRCHDYGTNGNTIHS